MEPVPQWVVELYEKENGDCPVKEFISSLQVKEQVRVRNKLERLQRYGLKLGGDYFRHLEEDIWEYRLQSRAGFYRFLYILHGGHTFVILHAFKKKTNKIPRRHIETAKRYRDDYLSREERRKSR
jgi:phage-related protein